MNAWWLALRLLLLLAAANAAPILLKQAMGPRWAAPIDGGRRFVDGRPWLGPAKTWRGLAGAVLAATLLAPALGLPAHAGALAGLGAMVGDALSSFVKRRLGVPSSGRAYGIDQVPEALVPLLLLESVLELGWTVIAGVTLAFLLLEPPAARMSYRLGLRDRPY